MVLPYNQRTENESIVYFTRDLSSRGLIKAYEKVCGNISGRVGVKLHTGEKKGPNIIPRGWVKKLIEKKDKYTEKWDDDACVPYLVWKGQTTNICSFENASSIAAKCKYIKNKGLGGAMVWSYDHDDSNGTLRKALRKGLWGY